MLAVSGDAARAWRAVLINFLYFFPLAVGMMIWPAIVRSSRGRWAGGVMRRTAFSAVTFAPASILLFVLLFFGREHWATWIHHARPPQQAWLNQPFVFIRDGAGILLLWILGAIFVRRSGRGADTPYLSPWLVFTFCIVLTIIGLDMVMSLQPKWYRRCSACTFSSPPRTLVWPPGLWRCWWGGSQWIPTAGTIWASSWWPSAC